MYLLKLWQVHILSYVQNSFLNISASIVTGDFNFHSIKPHSSAGKSLLALTTYNTAMIKLHAIGLIGL